jgi:hypothetical protein
VKIEKEVTAKDWACGRRNEQRAAALHLCMAVEEA